jgi:hypothetical protein
MKALVLGLALLGVACTEEPAGEVADTPAADAPSADPAPAAPPAAATSAAIPAAFHGRWDASAEACATGSEMKLTITESELLFLESVAKPTSVASRGPDAIRIEADFSGEGEEWEGTLELSLASDTLTVTQPSGSTSRVRCP